MAQQNLRARQQQRQRMMIILVLLLVAGGAAFFFLGNDTEAKKKKGPRPIPKGLIAVPVAKKDMPLGTRISNQLIIMTYKKPREVPTDALLAREEFIGRFVTKPILEGQYIQQGVVGVEGAVGGFSAMATQGKRLIVINANLFPGSLETLKVGDHIDLLAFQGIKASGARGPKRNSGAVDGSQPGNATGKVRRSSNSNQNGNQLVDPVSPMNATLIAENAEVMSVPKARRSGKKGGDYVVFQMNPQDAHVTTLMTASGVMLRAVFRPYGDNTRLTQDAPPSITTRLPKSVGDPDMIQVIADGATYVTKANSRIFLNEETENRRIKENMPNMIFGKSISATESNPDANENGVQQKTAQAPEDNNLSDNEAEEQVQVSKSTKRNKVAVQDNDLDADGEPIY